MMNFEDRLVDGPLLPAGTPACRWSEFSCRKPSDKRRHGDPFPLPRLGDQVKTDQPTRQLDSAIGLGHWGLEQLSHGDF